MSNVTFPLDLSGNNPTNLVRNELHTVSESRFRDYFFLVPNFSPFYIDNFSLVLSNNNNDIPLVEDVDFSFAIQYVTGTRVTGKVMYGAITLHNLSLNGILKVTYQTLGGDQVADRLVVLSTLADKAYNPKTTIWDILTGVPQAFPPTPHYQDYNQFFGQEAVVHGLGQIRDAILTNSTITAQEIGNLFNTLNLGSLSSYLRITGGTMTGPLTLHGNPTDSLHATTKQYVDGLIANNTQLSSVLSNYALTSYVDQQDALKLNKAGDVMLGPLSLNQAPTQPSHAVTKQYVDNIQQNFQSQFNQLRAEFSHLTVDPVTKSYVDNKVNEIMALLSSYMRSP